MKYLPTFAGRSEATGPSDERRSSCSGLTADEQGQQFALAPGRCVPDNRCAHVPARHLRWVSRDGRHFIRSRRQLDRALVTLAHLDTNVRIPIGPLCMHRFIGCSWGRPVDRFVGDRDCVRIRLRVLRIFKLYQGTDRVATSPVPQIPSQIESLRST